MLELNAVNLIHVFAGSAFFLMMWAVLGRVLMKPFFDTVYEREAKTAGADESTQEKREEGRRLDDQLRHQIQDARLEGLRIRDSRVQQAKNEAQSLREAAMNRAAQENARTKDELAQVRAKTVSELELEVEKLATLLVSQVLEKPAGRVLH